LLQAAIDADVPVRPLVIAYVNKDGTLSEALPYYGKLTMKQSLKKVLDSKDVTAFVLPLEPIDPKGLSKSELTDLLQAHMQEGLAELHSRVLTKAAKV